MEIKDTVTRLRGPASGIKADTTNKLKTKET